MNDAARSCLAGEAGGDGEAGAGGVGGRDGGSSNSLLLGLRGRKTPSRVACRPICFMAVDGRAKRDDDSV